MVFLIITNLVFSFFLNLAYTRDLMDVLFAMVSNAVDTLFFFAQSSECQSGENFKQARASGSHVGMKPVFFVTQPKLRIMCLLVLRQLPRLHFVSCQVISVVLLLSSRSGRSKDSRSCIA